ncbi:hypothetical protein [Solibacillus sp. FSL H8-0538]|uniref:hypothetical protein n=1 Tax=Solibacillus sp. FSL H8-0538 TaxID=2921400 RepID=UPI0030F9F8BD
MRLKKSWAALGTPTTFEEIMQWVYEHRIEGFGPVGVYDTALRIGVYMGIYPEMVYIHAGSKEGTKLLLGKDYTAKIAYYFMGDLDYPVLDPLVYPEEIQNLAPYHIENFLCNRINKIRQFVASN